MKELKHLNKYLYKYKHLILLGLLFVIISNIFVIAPAPIVRHAIDYVTGTLKPYHLMEGTGLQDNLLDQIFGHIAWFVILIILMAVGRGIFLFLVRQTIIVMSRYIEFDLKNEIYNHYQELPLGFYRKNNTGDLMARISEDVSRVRMYLGPAIMYGLNLVTLFLMVIPYMISINPKLTLYALIPLPILSISIYYVNNIINKRSEEIQRSLSGLSTFVQEAFSGIRVIKSFVREEDSAKNFTKESNNYKHKNLRLVFVNALFLPLIMGLIGLSVILTVYIGGNEVILGNITVGNIAEFIIYVNMLTWPVTSLGWITSIIQRAEASQGRINEFLNTKNEIISEKNIDKNLKGKITFENVTFKYPDSGITALKDISFEIDKGKSLAVIGTTGSGKSTLANLISRMYDANEGQVRIDDIPIRDIKVERLRSSLGYVPQDVFLFSDSIKNNIAFGTQNLTDEQIHQAAKDADVYYNIIDFPNQFETVLGERGITLSGGQKQRVSLARAIVRNPKILILDDSLSAVDTKTENAILNSLQEIMKGKTSVIISHRVSSAKLADHIIVLDEGRIVEKGTHDELMNNRGPYFELYEKQLTSEDSGQTQEL
ncbi:ABC transporter ATP-binding protein [Mangrovivirga cuniculi]|uniref:ABC transporter n=1 Tax=Mangrovivirga cuniculi TaxID=2715131 RepID=A0A4D7K8C5_9BACT|nr:ABC transporter ATP-binding protein [Mangrovivirga cuniculi]QCK16984.1 ABC transporter [Mangrovivirga cuniculi]